ncbi:MAG: menaquinone-dependent protoporphyrinogen oxidase HemG [Rhodobacteraceae bacterium HLUCCA08]|nr:MAG: menaquinone-dependent protoporphyrinogen oxidase HemG [Rhodobacteraceae bacterium HLUCCA08]
MKVLVAYATREGQTRRIARHVADRIVEAGHTTELLNLDDAADIGPDRFDRAVLAASVHAGQYQRALGDFAARHADALARMPTLFLSVSLAAAGHDAEEWRSLDRILSDMNEATGWTPGQVAQVAGAYRPSDYDFFTRFIMRRIIATKDPKADLDTDHEYTDWPALDALVDGWIAAR